MCNLHFLLQLHLTSCGIQAAVADADDAADAADVADAADAEDAADAADVADAAAPAVSWQLFILLFFLGVMGLLTDQCKPSMYETWLSFSRYI